MLKEPILVALSVITLTACRTTDKRSQAPISAPERPRSLELALNEPGKFYSLNKDESQSTYLKMLKIEMDSGTEVPHEKQHSVRGVVECRQLAAVQNCLLRVSLAGDEAAPMQPLDSKLTARALNFALESRPDLKDEGVIFANLICDYVGKKSPPFQLEDVRCYFDQPRLPNEALFEGKIAQELGEAIRGDAVYGTNIVQLNGALFCHWLEVAKRSVCITRTNVNGVLQEAMVELTPAASYAASRSLRQAVVDQSHIGSVVTSKDQSLESKSPIPIELMSALSCVVDNTRIELDGERTYLCRARI
ncbi:MAG: hypothetical protein RL011_2446 [Pseudomonadota bacterium]